MSDLSVVRNLIGDPYLYDRAEAIGDGITLEFHVPNAPVKAGSEKVYVQGVEQTDITDYSFNDALGLLALTVAAGDGETVTVTYQHSLLSDSQLQDFIDLEDGDLKLAAADALDSIASTQSLILKVIKVLDLQTDGAKLADSLHKRAQDYRKLVLDAELQGSDFDYAEMINNASGFYEKVVKDIMREG